MSPIRLRVRQAIAAIARSADYAWLLTTAGRRLLRECYGLGLAGEPMPVRWMFDLPAWIAFRIGEEDRRRGTP